MNYRHTAGHLMLVGLFLALLISACGEEAQVAEPAGLLAQPTPVVAILEPSIFINPLAGGADTLITVTGTGFPAWTAVGVHLGLPEVSASRESYASALTDAQGEVTLEFTLPTAWLDGRPIREERLAVVLATADFGSRAAAEFQLVPGSEPSLTVSPSTASPGDQITVSGHAFPAGQKLGLHLGLLAAGATLESYGEIVADQSGDFSLSFEMPAAWPDGSPITESELVLVVASADFRVRASSKLTLETGTAAPELPGSAEGTRTVLSWRREGGLTGLCEELAVDDQGAIRAGTCEGGAPRELANCCLTEAQVALISRWAESLAPFELQQMDSAAVDELTITLAFSGLGNVRATAREQQAMVDFAKTLFVSLTQPPRPESETLPTWTRARLAALDISFEVPSGWQQQGEVWAWQGAEGELVLGLNYAEDIQAIEPYILLLPEDSQVIASEAVDLGWASGRQVVVAVEPGVGQTPAQHHFILTRGDGRWYDFYLGAPTSRSLLANRPLLQRMVNAVTFGDGASGRNNPVQVSVEFLAAWLRDSTGVEGAVHLSQALRQRMEAGDSLETLLGLGPGFDTFSSSWLSTAGGQSQVQVALSSDGANRQQILVLVLEGNTWRIDGLK